MEDSQPSLSRRRRDLDHVGKSTTTIPFDLIIEILSQLPGKSLIRFQSVSKLWLSTIGSKYFVDLFLTRSKTRPRLLLSVMNSEYSESRKRFILSAPEHNNREDDKSSSTVIPRHDMTISNPVYCMISCPVNGMICCIGTSSISVCNPTTRQVVKLPDVVTPNGRSMHARLGYDPVEDQYKVLCVMSLSTIFGRVQQYIQEHFVCTVRTSPTQEWRKIDNTTIDNYCTIRGDICIDGAIYYVVGQSRIVRFDVRSEKMELIKAPKESDFSTRMPTILLNYNGKLGGVDFTEKKVMRLWTLEDAEKQEWSSMTFAFPSGLEQEYFLGAYVVSRGEIHTGKFMVFHPGLRSSTPFYVCYYDFNKESARKVKILLDSDFRRILGIGLNGQILSFPGYFENIRLL